jgi:hypothetical protein
VGPHGPRRLVSRATAGAGPQGPIREIRQSFTFDPVSATREDILSDQQETPALGPARGLAAEGDFQAPRGVKEPACPRRLRNRVLRESAVSDAPDTITPHVRPRFVVSDAPDASTTAYCPCLSCRVSVVSVH